MPRIAKSWSGSYLVLEDSTHSMVGHVLRYVRQFDWEVSRRNAYRITDERRKTAEDVAAGGMQFSPERHCGSESPNVSELNHEVTKHI